MTKEILKYVLFLFIALSCKTNNESSWKSYSGDKDIERRVDSVLNLMTLDEKIGQMAQYSVNWDITGPVMPNDFHQYLEKGLVGSLFNCYTVEGVKKFQEIAMSKSRLKIPILFGFDVIHGYRTIFPMPLAESCSWDLDLMRRTAAISAAEATSSGINWTFAPMIDISRDPRWGRVMEGAGEDPYLTSLIGVAKIEGYQGENLSDTTTLLACAKHFAAYGAAEAGRDYNTVDISNRTLFEIYLQPFIVANKAKVATFMASFNEIGGMPATSSEYLLTDILRDEWDFRGFVVTDYTGINELVPHGVAATEKEAGEKAVNAGIDMDMTGAVFSKYLRESVDEGEVETESIDMAVRRILEMKFLLGLFDNPYKYLDTEREKNTLMRPEYLQTAREAVSKSIVLLKNNDNILPIEQNKNLTIALIGPMVNNRESLNGEWAGRGQRSESVTLHEGLVDKYKGSNVKFISAQGADLTSNNRSGFNAALALSRKADIIIAAMGESYHYSGEAASRTDIKLPGFQQELLMELKKTGKPIVLVLMNGRPLDLSWEDENIDAILECWYGGTMAGHGIADIIAGDYNPSAKLTMSFPRNVGQIPVYYNAKNTGRPLPADNPKEDYKSSFIDSPNSPLYPFGYGLSYTTFKISNLRLDKNKFSSGEDITATVDIENTGDKDGEIIVQLYIRDISAAVTRPLKELKDFKKIMLKRGEKRELTFVIDENSIAYYNLDMQLEPEDGEFSLFIGQDAQDNSNMINFWYTKTPSY